MSEPATTFVVWTQDFEFTLSPSEPEAGRDGEAKVKARCAACWGGLVLRGKGENGVVTSITCRVCNEKLAGKAADDEYRRILEEATANARRVSMGFPPTHERGRFVCKLFPSLPRLTEDEVRQRIASKTGRRDRGGQGARGSHNDTDWGRWHAVVAAGERGECDAGCRDESEQQVRGG